MPERTNFDSLHTLHEPQPSLENSGAVPSLGEPTGTSRVGRWPASRFDLYRQSNLTTNQLQVWIGQSLVPQTPIYHLAVALNICGEIDPRHFQQAFQVLINSSDALRTVVEEIDGIPSQRVVSEMGYALDLVDLSYLSEKQQRIKGWMEDRCQTPLNWQKRLFDSTLIKLAAQKFVWYFNVHHLICDAWSFELIYRHMAELYQQSLQGNLPQTVPLLAFADYVTHERAHRESPRYRRAETYWKQKLEENGEPISFYGKVPQIVTTRTRRISYNLDPNLTTRLRSSAALTLKGTESVSLLNVFVAALVAYLHCLNGKQSYTIGVPFHNRRSKAFKETLGFFSEILPVRIAVADDDTFASLLHKVREEIFKTARHGQHPITNPHFKKVYEVVVNYHSNSFYDFAGMPASPEWIHNGHGDDNLALQIHDFAASGNLVLDFDLHESIFDEQESQQAITHFSHLLEAFAAHPRQPLRGLTLLSSAEARGVITEWNRSVPEPTDQRGVHELFEEQAAIRSNDIAVVLDDKQLTYHELNSRANKLAHFLQRCGVGPGTLVDLYVERSIEMLVGLLAILKAGGTYVPLDPKYPRAWFKSVLDDTRAPVLLTQRKFLASLPQDCPEIIYLDSTPEAYACESDQNLKREVAGDQLAYVIYTSGSTGAPKGVEIPHKALMNFTKYAGRSFGVGPGDRVLQFASISFDAAVEEIFPCLIHGATLVLRTDSMLDSVPVFLKKCQDWGITVLDLPTAYWHELTARLFSESLLLPEQIRLVIIGGERAIPERLALWQACVAKRVRLLNTYGPTEATVAATMCELTDVSEDSHPQEEFPIGRPIPNVQTYVLDQNLNPVPPGVPGELYIGGIGLARGYFNRPELTAVKFVPNPFTDKAESRLYRTGDLVRYRTDRNLEFLRRIDRQVKVRGFRVELEGIEAVLRKHPLVQEAVVVQDSLSTLKPLVVYLVPKDSAALNMDELRAYATKRLPEYMVPAILIALDSLPFTPSGKVDYQALSPHVSAQAEPPKSYAPPRTPTEKQIAGIWCDVLGIQRVSRDDHFFELGGHSLLAIQVISRIRKEFELDIALRAIFEAPTIVELAQRVEEAIATGLKPSEIVPSAPPPGATQAPLSFSQTRIWFMDQLAPGSAAYNIAATVRFTGILHKETLKQSLNEVVRRHESLRTTFRNTGGEPLQVVTPELVLEMPEIDLREVSEASRLEKAKRLLRQEASRPFDLERGPLLRVLLCQLDEEDQILLLNMHHAISDQWSIGIIVREITSLYNGFCNASPVVLEPLPVQYSNFAASQSRYLAGERWEAQLSYWKKQLSDLQPLDLPTDHLRPSVQTFHGAHDQLSLPTHMLEGLRKLSLQENATLFMAFLAAFKAILLRYSGQEDIAIGSPIANRNRTEWEGVVGTFINVLVLRTDLSGNPTFREVLRRVREVVLDAFAHQEMPFEKLVEELQFKRDPSRSPLVQVLFNFHTPPAGKINLAGLSWVPFEIDQWASQFDIGVTIDPEITKKIWVVYNTDLYEAATITRMLRHYAQFLEAVAEDPDRPIGKIRILTDPERRQLLVDWNDTTRDYPKDRCLHELFESWVQQSPDATAVVFDDKRLTYRELNQQANQLACRLRELGVGPEILVGLCFERSLEMVVALLGILKAGGAYVPIDPVYPFERIVFMAKDSAMHLLLTQEKLVERLRQTGRQIVSIERLAEDSERENRENPPPLAKPQNLAYVIYTSGSTGRPKGVQVEHGAVVNFLCSMRKEPGISSQDILLSVTTASFDIAVLEFFLPLTVGARVVLVSREVASDGRQLKQQLDNSRATIMQATPVTWQVLLEAGWKAHRNFKILCGGEALSLNLAKALLKNSSSVWNLYGPTETTVWSTACQVEPGGDRVFIGRPIANTQAYVLDSNLEPVPIGVAGELYIGGDGVARGYLNRPELTAAKFIHNPFRNDPTARLYKTGDCARYLPDGNVEFLGRKDHQVKIRGFRVEPSEIETLLSQHPAVHQVVVLAREDMPGGKRLVAYVVPHQQAAPAVSELRLLLKAQLPEYMVPSAFVLLERLPLSQNGKLDRKALPVPDKDNFESETGFLAPRDPVELQLTKIWEELLNIRPIGVKDNFFDLGGHSLLAVRLGAQIEKVLGKNLPLATLFQAPTIEQLASLIGREKATAPWSSMVALQPHGSRPPFFWVHGELSNAFLPRYLGPDQPLYGLEHQSQDGKRALYTSVENIAAHYLKEICTVQPQGPYFLGGYCFGGMVALEMTHQLRKQGQETALLVLLNPPDPTPNLHNTLPRVLLFRDNRYRHFLSLGGLRHQEKLTYVLEKVKRKLEETITRIKGAGKRFVKSAVCKVYLGLGYLLPPFVRSFYILSIYDRAGRDYLPQIYPGRLIIFKGARDSCDSQSWERLAGGGLEIHEVPGDHVNILKEPQVRVWAEQLKDHLQKNQIVVSCSQCIKLGMSMLVLLSY